MSIKSRLLTDAPNFFPDYSGHKTHKAATFSKIKINKYKLFSDMQNESSKHSYAPSRTMFKWCPNCSGYRTCRKLKRRWTRKCSREPGANPSRARTCHNSSIKYLLNFQIIWLIYWLFMTHFRPSEVSLYSFHWMLQYIFYISNHCDTLKVVAQVRVGIAKS